MPDSKKMAYGGNDGGTDSRTYRVERGQPYMRAGKVVAPMPQFKTSPVYTSQGANVPGSFRVVPTHDGTSSGSTIGLKVQYPIPTVPTTQKGQ